MRIRVYVLSPIDDWSGWLSKRDMARNIIDHWSQAAAIDEIEARLDKYVESLRFPLVRAGWEDPRREGPYFSMVPTGDVECVPLVALKQDNNGTTFVISPVSLPHLEKYHLFEDLVIYGGPLTDWTMVFRGFDSAEL